ncbi:hypothetical protein F9L33_08475 [Amylibacter sp. SFDW26]|uniref:hypothetical protein n=1 Tax=Amylibacter sp. SFDW26 TaxID=2652722 RepID=UPI0012626788|nr:hypothetical protein [Amylibacter sp. SFDW26]KAB7614660.1 hypothetical protein F9L33_08475 [Amylibacter sp. SFDW26]
MTKNHKSKNRNDEFFYGESLCLVNHDNQLIYDFNKIINGGIFNERLSDFVIDDDISEEDVRDYRSHVLLHCVGAKIELIITQSKRHEQLTLQGYETVYCRKPFRVWG